MTISLDQRVARLESIETIRRLIARYAQGADRRNDPAIMAGLFTADAVWECQGFGRYQGRDDICANLARIGRDEIVWTLHYMAAPIIDVPLGGDWAHCSWWLWELAKMPAAAGGAASNFIGGFYDAQLRDEGQGWRFSSVRLDLKLISPHAPGWETRP